MSFSLLAIASTLTAQAATPIDLDWSTQIEKDVPSCSGDYECTQALKRLESQVRQEAKTEAKQACGNAASTFHAARSEFQSLYIRDIDLVVGRPYEGRMTYYVSGKLNCILYTD